MNSKRLKLNNFITVRENVPEFPLVNKKVLKETGSGIAHARKFTVSQGKFKGLSILTSHELHQDLCWLHVSASRVNCREKIITLLDIAFLKQNFYQPKTQVFHVVDTDVNQIYKVNLWHCLDKIFLNHIPFNEGQNFE